MPTLTSFGAHPPRDGGSPSCRAIPYADGLTANRGATPSRPRLRLALSSQRIRTAPPGPSLPNRRGSGPPAELTAAAIRLCKIYFLSLLLWRICETSSGLPKFCRQEKHKDGGCQFRSNPERLTCRRNLNYDRRYSTTKVVFSCSWFLGYINPEEILNAFHFVQKLTIRNGNVSEFLTDFPESKYLHSLILVNLNLKEVRSSLFVLLENLKLLDLSHNHLKNLPPETVTVHPSLVKVVLADNPWNCSSDLKWILDKSINSKVANKNLVRCGGNVYPGKPVYFVMSLIKKMERDCPTHICSCTMNNIVWDAHRTHLIPVITVDCSERGLTELPEKLPANTTSLVVSRNNISDLLPVVRSEVYRNVADIYLDDNCVTSIDVLEGALWLETFRVLSLRGNGLSQLPIYALDNAFEKNTNVAKLYLGNNPWKCDCLFIPEFQHLLIKYNSIIKDKSDIKCFQEEGNGNSNRQIVLLSTKSVCRRPESGVNVLDVLSAVFASLIFLVVGKLVYDYWTFKTTGKLPWIVTKMP